MFTRRNLFKFAGFIGIQIALPFHASPSTPPQKSVPTRENLPLKSGSPLVDAQAKAWKEAFFLRDDDALPEMMQCLVITPTLKIATTHRNNQIARIKQTLRENAYSDPISYIYEGKKVIQTWDEYANTLIEFANIGRALNIGTHTDSSFFITAHSPYSNYWGFQNISFSSAEKFSFFPDYTQKIDPVLLERILFYHECLEVNSRELLQNAYALEKVSKKVTGLQEEETKSLYENLTSDVAGIVLLLVENNFSPKALQAVQQHINWRLSQEFSINKEYRTLGVIQKKRYNDIIDLAKRIQNEGPLTPEKLYRKIFDAIADFFPKQTEMKRWQDIISKIQKAIQPTIFLMASESGNFSKTIYLTPHSIDVVLEKEKNLESADIIELIQEAIKSANIPDLDKKTRNEKKIAVAESLSARMLAYQLSPERSLDSLLSHAFFYRKRKEDLYSLNMSAVKDSMLDLAIESTLQFAHALAKELGIDLQNNQNALAVFPEMEKDPDFYNDFLKDFERAIQTPSPFSKDFVKNFIQKAEAAAKRKYSYKIPNILKTVSRTSQPTPDTNLTPTPF